jgi:hypothetical protein
MKTKSIFQKLVLAVVILAAATQRSPAPVGYVNVVMSPGWNLVANPLNLDNTNNANNVLSSYSQPADGSLLYRFDPASQNYKDAATYLN